MNKLKRRIFFWTLVLVFLIIAPTIVLHTRGYRFDWSRGVFVYSGTITFKTNPENVDVSLNGVRAEAQQLGKINNSLNLSGLLPGDYDFALSAPGFHSWDKKTDVHSGVSNEFWNIILTRTDYKRNNYSGTQGTDRFFISPKNDLIALSSKDNSNLSIKTFNITDKAIEKNYSIPDAVFSGEKLNENIEWSPENDYLSVPVEKTATPNNPTESTASAPADAQKTTEDHYYIIDLATDNTFNLNEFLGKNDIRDVRWDPKTKGYLFFLEGSDLFRSNVADASDIKLIASDVSAFDLSRADLYYVQSTNDLVFKSNLAGDAGKTQLTNSFPADGAKMSKLIIYDDDRISFLSENKDLYIYNRGEHDTYFRKLSSGVLESHFSDDGKKLLYWTDNEISVYYVRDWLVQPIRQENSLENITRYSEPLRNVQWYKDYEHVIFTVGKYTKVIELDPRDHRNCLDLIDTADSSSFMIYDNLLERLFYTDTQENTSGLNYIVFPEPIPFLGLLGGTNQQQ
ncbi:MAG: hypothetical protein HGB08_01740 [Candidatus Moranbacteria bacterium]|nr:hypothetical protein [Candidatus Moranbacteria bacterium]